MTNPACHLCRRTSPELRELVHARTGGVLRVCATCLRTTSQAKAAWSDERGRERLLKAARNGAREVWRSDHVLYLMPPMAATSGPEGAVLSQPPRPTSER